MEVERELWAIEVKASRDVRGVSLSGLKSLQEACGARLKRKTIVLLGERAQKWEDFEALPLADFMAQLPM